MNFENLIIDNGCKECESDIITLLEHDKNKDHLLNEYIESHINKDMFNLIHSYNKLNIKHIPDSIKNVLFDGYL
jgi:hypothetical protein